MIDYNDDDDNDNDDDDDDDDIFQVELGVSDSGPADPWWC